MQPYIPRLISKEIEEANTYFPVIIITGPRQSGKTSLCHRLFPDYKYYNLEDLTTRGLALADPNAFMETVGDKVIIDEIQHAPDLLSQIQVNVDNDRSRRYILTGSSNFSLLHTISQSLAGRASLFTLLPFSFPELSQEWKSQSIEDLMFKGQYPGVVADSIPPLLFYKNYYTTYVERDVHNLLRVKNLPIFDKFVRLIAARVGTEFNASALARETGVSANTITEWLAILQSSYIAYTVTPYYANISKRLTKMPKVYFYDTGLLCYLLGIEDPSHIGKSTLKGLIFENLAMGELIKKRFNAGLDPNMSFYREYTGKEVDALISSGGLHLYEIKAGKTFHKEYVKNIEYLKKLLPDIVETHVIYDGEPLPPLLMNIRNV